MRFQQYYATALRLGWFDPCFYLDGLHAQGLAGPDDGISLFEHYATVGWKHGLAPSDRFCVGRYLERYPDVSDRQLDPLYHYLARGQREQREAFPLLDTHDDVQFIGWHRAGVAGGQLALPRSQGITAFCIEYHANLERDILRQMDAHTSFCLSFDPRAPRSGDGDAGRGEDGSLEADYGAIYDLVELLSDPRYLRVSGKPLLVVERPERLTDARLTFELWREVARRAGLGGIYVAGVPANIEPGQDWGLDGLLDVTVDPLPASASIATTEGFAEAPLPYEYRAEQHALPVFPGFIPEPAASASPESFRGWLSSVAARTRELGARRLPKLVFVDGHSAWADGSQEFVKAAEAAPERLRQFAHAIVVSSRLPVLFLCDPAASGEAQRLMRRLIGSLGQLGSIECFMVGEPDGLSNDLQRCAAAFSLGELSEAGWSREQAVECLANLLGARSELVVVSDTLTTAALLAPFASRGHRLVSMVSELPAAAELAAGGSALRDIAGRVQRLIVGSESAQERISAALAIPRDDIVVIEPGVPRPTPDRASRSLRDLGLPDARHVVVACGTVQHSNGPDLFIQAARHLAAGDHSADCLFVWLARGHSDAEALKWAQHDAHSLGLAERVKFIDHVDDPEALMQLADVLLVTSREDAEPLAVLEAVSAGVRVVCFDTAGGTAQLVSQGFGHVVAYLDCQAMAEAARPLGSRPEAARSAPLPMAEPAGARSWDGYVENVADCLLGLGNDGRRIRFTGRTLGRQLIADDLCVVIPSYNHRAYILQALDSILAQSLRPKEIRIIDDGSDDGSAQLVESLASEALGIFVRARENRGAHATINEAIGETACPIVAIMNSDDLWHPLRIEQLIGELRRPGGSDVVFSRLRFIDSQRRADDKVRWYESGIADYETGGPLWLSLMFCNFFFTTSNLVAKREKFLEAGGLGPFRYCHDLDYMLKAIFAGHEVQFVAQTLCEYRVHDSNTIDQDIEGLLFEEAWLIAKYLKQNRQRISQEEMTRAARRCLDKGLLAKVLGILQALGEHQLEFDYKTTFGAPHYPAIAAHISDCEARGLADPAAIVDAMRASPRDRALSRLAAG